MIYLNECPSTKSIHVHICVLEVHRHRSCHHGMLRKMYELTKVVLVCEIKYPWTEANRHYQPLQSNTVILSSLALDQSMRIVAHKANKKGGAQEKEELYKGILDRKTSSELGCRCSWSNKKIKKRVNKKIWNFWTTNMNKCPNCTPKISEKRHMYWFVQKRQNAVLFGTSRSVSYITPICLFCTDQYIWLFSGDFWCADRTLVHVHCPKKSDLFEFFY